MCESSVNPKTAIDLIPWNLKSLQPLGHSGKDAIRVGRHELSSQSQPFTYT